MSLDLQILLIIKRNSSLYKLIGPFSTHTYRVVASKNLASLDYSRVYSFYNKYKMLLWVLPPYIS